MSKRFHDNEPIIRDDRFEISVRDKGDFGFRGRVVVKHKVHGWWDDWPLEFEEEPVAGRAYELYYEIEYPAIGKAVAAAKGFLKRWGTGTVEVLQRSAQGPDVWEVTETIKRGEGGWKDRPDPLGGPA